MHHRCVWVEQYHPCGCSSEAWERAGLLGYCATHGSDRSALYYVPRALDDGDEAWRRRRRSNERRRQAGGRR